ncbi:MAG: 16S rRNA (uracil(1498)-N(3))-methyltransferase [Bacteroidales bacterium]|nr:16S rRNA (uracil(1498)-N(3))-methyltransferase [Bacteroidales bacterium]
MELLVDPNFAPGRILSEEESAHCVKVMRHRVGDTLFVADGKGNRYECQLVDASPRGCTLNVLSTTVADEPKCHLWMAVAPTKNIDRFEWFVEKAVEIGVSRITPILCAHSERDRVRVDRLEKLVLAAAKQSLKCFLPSVDELTRFADLLASPLPPQRYILHCGENPKPHLFSQANPATDTLILIGPEGDFSAKEIVNAAAAGFQECTLGPERLRTETAALVATNVIAIRNQVDAIPQIS